MVRLASVSILGLELPLLLLWFVLATVLATITQRIADWNDMTDELVWERLAVSVGQYHSVLPRLHGEVIRNLAQLYPALISPFFFDGYVTANIRNVHVFDAWVMSSAALPAFLLARRVTGRRWAAYLLAVLAVCTPWIVYSTVLLTEVAAYPTFLWAVLAMHAAITRPSKRNDALVMLALAVTFLVRTQFGLLAAILPVALVAYHLTAPDAGPWRRRLAEALRGHVVLAAVYVPLALAAAVFVLAGGKPTRLSVYGAESSPQVLSTATAGAATGHAADLAFGMGILPFLVGAAWLLANVVRRPATPGLRAFAWLGATTLVVLVPVVAAWDLTIGQFVIDRYLFYLAPLLFLATVCALLDVRRPRWSLVIPVAVVCVGFALHLQPEFLWSGQFPLSFDSPVASLYKPFADLGGGASGASTILVVLTIALAALFVVGARLLRPAVLTAVVAVLLLVALPADTGYTFEKLLSRNGHSGRPLTQSQSGVLDWLDRAVGTGGNVTEVPYPVSSSPFVSQGFWRDLEFWNKSVRYAVHYPTPDVYRDAVIWFPDTPISFNPVTGAASASPSPYVVQSVTETRFRISGTAVRVQDHAMLIQAEMPWRTDWLTDGLYDDGWTQPGRGARIRVYMPGQRGAVKRTLSFQVQAPPDVSRRPFTLTSNLQTVRGAGTAAHTVFTQIDVCVPPRGFAVVGFRTRGSSEIPGDPKSIGDSTLSRQGGLLIADLSLADEVGPPCRPAKMRT